MMIITILLIFRRIIC